MSYPYHDWLPLVFTGLMALSILIYVILDGFDLGVGVLSPWASEEERDIMIGSIGPFWDANETWLVLSVGLLLTAFPAAHGIILTALYVPTTLMLIGLILRGVAFEFRSKGPKAQKRAWDWTFFAGSLLTTLCQGYMLGVYVLGLQPGLATMAFGALTAVCLAAAYGLMGATWLIAKTEGVLQLKSVRWAWVGWLAVGVGMMAVSLASPLASERIYEKWFTLPNLLFLAPIPLITAAAYGALAFKLLASPPPPGRAEWTPFLLTAALFALGFIGLGYSFFPYVVPDQLTLWEAASGRGSLAIMLIGAGLTLPMILGYSIYVFMVFAGKATAIRYE